MYNFLKNTAQNLCLKNSNKLDQLTMVINDLLSLPGLESKFEYLGDDIWELECKFSDDIKQKLFPSFIYFIENDDLDIFNIYSCNAHIIPEDTYHYRHSFLRSNTFNILLSKQ